MFLPCTVNLDPKLREIIADVRDAREQMHLGGVSYPTMPLQDVSARPQSVFSQQSLACSPTGSFPGSFPTGGVLSPTQPHSSYFSGLTGPQHPFYNRSQIKFQPNRITQDSGAGVSVGPMVLLSSLSIDGVCEKLRQIQGLEQCMLEEYVKTVKKANVNGRVLSQCNLDELRKEMNMNFGDWHLFRTLVLEQRQIENQLFRDELGACSEQSSSVLTQPEPMRPSEAPRGVTANPENFSYTLNLSFEDLSSMGLEEPSRHHSAHWLANTHRTASISSLNSQESSNDICRLTDKQQAEYRNAYQEYISHMAHLEVSAASRESPAHAPASSHENTKEREQDGRRPFINKSSKPGESAIDFSSAPDNLLDPITEEDEKSEHGSVSKVQKRKSKGHGPSYHSVPCDEEESGDEETDATPLLKDKAWAAEQDSGISSKRKNFENMLDKKSSDTEVRSIRSSSDRSLQDEDNQTAQEKKSDEEKEEEAHLIELVLESPVKKRILPNRLSNLQDEARMSICSDAPSEGSLLASSPEESWPASAVGNLNCSPDNAAHNNNINNSTQQSSVTNDSPSLIITPGSSTEPTRPTNQNLHGMHLKKGTSTGSAADAAEERESVL